MLTRRLFLFAAAFALSFSLPPVAAHADDAGALAFIQGFGDKSINTLTEAGITTEELRSRFKKLYDEGFDNSGISKFVLGRHWRKASPDQREEFMSLFHNFIVQTYSGRFQKYSGETFAAKKVISSQNNVYIVESEVVQPEGPPIRIEWRIVGANGGYKIYDITVEGVSMAITQRSEFASVIKQGGGKLDALIDALKKKTTELASNKS